MNKLAFLSFLFLLCTISCKDECDDVNCGPGVCVDGTCDCPDGYLGLNCEIEDLCFNSMCVNGTCNSDTGACDCEDGYEGDDCAAKIIDRYTGSWKSDNFNCDGSIQSVTFVFEQGATITDLHFYDFDDDDVTFDVNYDGNDLSVPLQEVDDVFIEGIGTINSDGTMSWSFDLSFDGQTSVCAGDFIKQ